MGISDFIYIVNILAGVKTASGNNHPLESTRWLIKQPHKSTNRMIGQSLKSTNRLISIQLLKPYK
jgi:hypothetical protein